MNQRHKKIAIGAAVALAVGAGALLLLDLGGGCDPCSPLSQPPEERWGRLEPRSVLIDSTWFEDHSEPVCTRTPYPAFGWDLGLAGAGLYVAERESLSLWSLSDPDRPRLLGRACRPVLGPWRKTDHNDYLSSVAVEGSLVWVGLEGGMGALLLDPQLRPRYQQDMMTVRDVAILMGRYGVAVDESRQLWLYDLGAAPPTTAPCLETEEQPACPGVRLGLLRRGGGEPVRSLWRLASTPRDAYLLTIEPAIPKRVRLWDVATLQAVLLAETDGLDGAVWLEGSEPRIAVTRGQVTELLAYRGGALVPLHVWDTPGGLLGSTRFLSDRLTASPGWLHVGSTVGRGTGQREYLISLELMADVSPAGYWNHYNADEASGARGYAPLVSLVHGERVYHSGLSFIDVHRIVPPPPPPPLFADNFESGDTSAWSGN